MTSCAHDSWPEALYTYSYKFGLLFSTFLFNKMLTQQKGFLPLTVPVTTIDALQHFETG